MIGYLAVGAVFWIGLCIWYGYNESKMKDSSMVVFGIDCLILLVASVLWPLVILGCLVVVAVVLLGDK